MKSRAYSEQLIKSIVLSIITDAHDICPICKRRCDVYVCDRCFKHPSVKDMYFEAVRRYDIIKKMSR